MDSELWDAIDRRFRESDIPGAVQSLEALLVREPGDRFRGLVGAQFDNPPSLILEGINVFIAECQKHFDVKAVYLEMNGFDINYGRWYFDFFGYAECGGDPDDLDWLCEWQSDYWPDVTLTGLESVQKDFEWYHENRAPEHHRYGRAYELAILLVMAKFVALIRSALQSGELAKRISVLATAHDFDVVGRFAS